MSIPAPSVEYAQLSPMLIMFGAAVAGVLVESFVPRSMRYRIQLALSLGASVAALVAVVLVARQLRLPGRITVEGAVAVDGPTLLLQGTLLVVGILAIMLIAERRIGTQPEKEMATASHAQAGGFDAFTAQAAAIPDSPAEHAAERAGMSQTEVFPLTLFALAGMLLFPASDDLLTMFVALEVLSLPLYLLCGLARRRRLMSQEAALKYFLLGAFSSAFFLYGIALLYGYAGTLTLSGLGDAIGAPQHGDQSMALVGVALLSVGLLFKIGAVPFHSWIPDVYQGAPTPITGFMAAATKIAAFGAMLRIFYVALPGLHQQWRPVLWAIAILTMAIGTISAVTQSDVKRMLAYSSIAHAGFILTGVIAANPAGLSATMFYLVAYGFSTLGAFAVVALVRNADGEEETDMSRWAGLGRDRPLVGAMFSMFLLAFAGIPLTSGFVAKFAVFKAATQGGAAPLVIVGVVASGVAAYFYVRVIVLMFFTESPADPPRVVVPGSLSKAAIAVTAAATIVLGIFPQPLLDLCDRAAQFVR
ncbi:MAG: NADH-quinone oxidoreductase subunit NuoN [Mycobacteriaceae bacterium]|nr:NADH-quinone oxidoreductase subunit NuoN [Mycobacteriaceae bacterium]